jgi:hypothetical protein
MSEHKLRQHLYHQIHKDHDDKLETIVPRTFASREHQVIEVIKYFNESIDELVYPTKSYAVAIIYAAMLQRHFRVPLLSALNDPALLYDNDPFFVPYHLNPYVYDRTLPAITLQLLEIVSDCLDNLPYQVQKTVEYFKKEFFLGKTLDEINSLLIEERRERV